jgi:hypothetical protein
MYFIADRSTSEADVLIKHIDGLYSYALALSRNRIDAEDLVQETHVRAIPAVRRLTKKKQHQKLALYDSQESGSIRSVNRVSRFRCPEWILTNSCLNFVRRR